MQSYIYEPARAGKMAIKEQILEIVEIDNEIDLYVIQLDLKRSLPYAFMYCKSHTNFRIYKYTTSKLTVCPCAMYEIVITIYFFSLCETLLKYPPLPLPGPSPPPPHTHTQSPSSVFFPSCRFQAKYCSFKGEIRFSVDRLYNGMCH